MMVGYAFVLVSLALIVLESRKVHAKRKRLMWLVITSLVIPFILNMISEIFLVIDLTPYGFSLFAIFMFIAFYKFQFINIEPIAMSKIVNGMIDPIIITDKEEKIVFANQVSKKYLPYGTDQLVNITLKESFDKLKENVSPDQHSVIDTISNAETSDDSIYMVKSSTGKMYAIKRQKIHDNKSVLGYVVQMNDLTEYYSVVDELRESNKQLGEANEKLTYLNSIAEQLATERERTRMAQHLHDTIGHDLVNIMTLTKLVVIEKDINTNAHADTIILNNVLDISTKLLNNVRDCVSSQDTGKAGRCDDVQITDRVRKLVQSMLITQIPIELTINGEENESHAFAGDAIFSAVREAVTNAVRHGQASRINVIIKFSKENVKVFIFDNGNGCDEIHKHMGLNGMEKAVRGAGGSIQFHTAVGEGFSVQISIPVQEDGT
jgi:signal transduction histidine kinase